MQKLRHCHRMHMVSGKTVVETFNKLDSWSALRPESVTAFHEVITFGDVITRGAPSYPSVAATQRDATRRDETRRNALQFPTS